MEVSGRKYASDIRLIFKAAECFRGRERIKDFEWILCWIWRKRPLVTKVSDVINGRLRQNDLIFWRSFRKAVSVLLLKFVPALRSKSSLCPHIATHAADFPLRSGLWLMFLPVKSSLFLNSSSGASVRLWQTVLRSHKRTLAPDGPFCHIERQRNIFFAL